MSIIAIASQYHAFQHQVGQRVQKTIDDVLIASLFAPSFTKIANGRILVRRRAELKEQLLSVLDMVGSWAIIAQTTLPLEAPRQGLLRYHLASGQAGTFEVMALMSCNEGGQITQIEEIYHQVPDAHQSS